MVTCLVPCSVTGQWRVLVGGEQPAPLEPLRNEGVDGPLVAVAGSVVQVLDVTAGDQQRNIDGDEADALDPADQAAVARPRREDDVVSVDDLLPAVLNHPVRNDVVRIGSEALGVGDRITPAVEHVLVVITDRRFVGVADFDRHGCPFVS